MKALSIRQPWAWAIVNGWKDIENRDWPTKVRETVLVHAGVKEESEDVDFVIRAVSKLTGISRADLLRRYLAERRLGGIVGQVNVTGCVTDSPSPWFFGRYGFTLSGAQPLPFRPLRGRLGFFEAGAINGTTHDGRPGC